MNGTTVLGINTLTNFGNCVLSILYSTLFTTLAINITIDHNQFK